jgi:secreted Zn-dependent insulinase-like peptidase
MLTSPSHLQALDGITLSDIANYAEVFRTQHSVECFFYGNMTLDQANVSSDAVVLARMDFLERCAKKKEIVVKNRHTHLESWFTEEPAERIVSIETELFGKREEEPDGVDPSCQLSVILEAEEDKKEEGGDDKASMH